MCLAARTKLSLCLCAIWNVLRGIVLTDRCTRLQVAIEALKFKAVKALSEYVLFDASTKDERLKKRLFKAPPSPPAAEN